MDVSFSRAAGAYQRQMSLPADIPSLDDAPEKPDFMQALGAVLQEAVATQQKSEATQMQALTGKAELSDLVTAVSSAELTLNTVVAIRDRVISAYQEILRMPI